MVTFDELLISVLNVISSMLMPGLILVAALIVMWAAPSVRYFPSLAKLLIVPLMAMALYLMLLNFCLMVAELNFLEYSLPSAAASWYIWKRLSRLLKQDGLPEYVSDILNLASDKVNLLIKNPLKLRADKSKPHFEAPELNAHFMAGASWVIIKGRMDDTLTQIVLKQCMEASKAERVLILINSMGGNADSASMICAAIKVLVSDPSKDVRALASGDCGSAAMTVFMMIPQRMRYAYSVSRLMIHAGRITGPHGFSFVGHDADERAALAKSNQDFVLRPIADNSCISERSLKAVISSKQDIFLDAETSKSLGLISAII